MVALVVTIVLLLILAGISIAQLTGSGLFEKAKLAEQKSKEAQEKEEEILSEYQNVINNYQTIDSTRESNNTEYSNTEKAIGTWVNGQTLYQKTYSLTNVTDGDIIDESFNINNISIHNMFGNCTHILPDGNLYNYGFSTGNNTWCVYLILGNDNMFLYYRGESSTPNVLNTLDVTIQYTKIQAENN